MKEEKEYLVLVNTNDRDIYVKCLHDEKKNEIEYYPLEDVKKHNAFLHTYEEAIKFCKEANVGIYPLVKGYNYYTADKELYLED